MPDSGSERKRAPHLPARPRQAAGIVSGPDGTVVVLCRSGGRSTRLPGVDAIPARALVSEAMPVDRSVLCELKLPFGPTRKSRRVLPSLLDLRLPFPVEECASCFCAHPKDAESGTLLAIAARDRDMVMRLEASCFPGGAHVVDSQVLALWDEALEVVRSSPGADQPCLVLYADSGGVAAVLGRGHRFLAAQWLGRHAPGALGRMLAARLEGGADAEGWPCLLVGSRVAELDKDLLSVAEKSGAACRMVEAPDQFLGRSLARRALGTARYPCNLRTGRWLHERVRFSVRRVLRGTALLIAMSGLLLGAAGVGWSQLVMQRQRAFEAELVHLTREIVGTRVDARGDHMLRQLGAAIAERETLSRRLQRGAMPGLEAVLAGLSAEADRLSLQLGRVALGETGLLIECQAPGRGAAAALQGWLSARGIADLQVAFAGGDAGLTDVTIRGRLP